MAPADTVPTSYWNPVQTQSRPLLDSQVGRLLAVERVPLAPGRWKLQSDLNLEIAYSPDGCWSRLSFHRKGSDFLYVPQALAEQR